MSSFEEIHAEALAALEYSPPHDLKNPGPNFQADTALETLQLKNQGCATPLHTPRVVEPGGWPAALSGPSGEAVSGYLEASDPQVFLSIFLC